MDDSHALSSFLTERLAQVGLDADTYGPYVLPLLLTTDDEEADADEWESVMSLLQASSETHSDDEHAWIDLRSDIEKAWADHKRKVAQQEQAIKEANARSLQEEIERERKIAQEAALLEKIEKKQTEELDETKRALVQRYAYEEDDDEQEEEEVVTNRQAAAEMALEKAKEARKSQVSTKVEERQKTKAAKLDKAKKLEERRKKATKGERKR